MQAVHTELITYRLLNAGMNRRYFFYNRREAQHVGERRRRKECRERITPFGQHDRCIKEEICLSRPFGKAKPQYMAKPHMHAWELLVRARVHADVL